MILKLFCYNVLMKNLYDLNDWSDIKQHQMIGEILMQCGKLNLIHLGMALDIQKFQALPLGEILLNMKIIDTQELEQVLLLQQKIDECIQIGER